MDLNVELLRRLCETPGAPGHEDRVRAIVIESLEPLCDEVSTDALGNVIAFKRSTSGSGPSRKLMLTGHMDEISFLVTHIDESGFIRITPLGGFDPKTLTAQRVVVHGKSDLLGVMGTKPVHIMTSEEKSAAPKLSDYFVDVGLPIEKVSELVSVGDVITRQRELVRIGATFNGKSFDDRVGVFVMLEAMARLSEHAVDVYAVASTQEEIGLRGATVAARNIEPDIGDRPRYHGGQRRARSQTSRIHHEARRRNGDQGHGLKRHLRPASRGPYETNSRGARYQVSNGVTGAGRHRHGCHSEVRQGRRGGLH